MYDIEHYLTAQGRDVFMQWLENMADVRAQANILARIDRMAAGNLGDCKSVGGGVSEIRIHHGAGYRVYFARSGRRILLLLTGGGKSSQGADIAAAQDYWNDWKARNAR